MADDEAKKAKQAEIDRKRAEVRKRMEEASKAKKAKKGFMTPDRKKKLRLLLRKKAAEELKKEQERKAAERRRIIEERCGRAKDLDDANEDDLEWYAEEFYAHIVRCESEKWDLEHEVRKKDWEIADLNSQVNDLRGKFVKPTLKKVSKYENKFAKLQKKAAEFNFRNQLKVVKKKEFTLEEEDKEKNLKTGIVDWSKKDEKKGGEAPAPEAGEAPAEAAPPAEAAEGEKPAAEGAPPAEGGEAAPAEGAPAEGAAPGEGAPADGEKPAEGAEGQPPAEGQPADGQPPEPEPEPEPPASEDDLWFYIREAVTNANPLSPEELIKKLIDAVQGVPSKLMKPVVEASIKRSQSIDLTTIDSLPPDTPVDPNAPPADPNAPVDPNAPPADPNAPVDPNAPPADPNAPVDPNAPPADPNVPPSDAPADGAPAPAPAEGAAEAPPADAPPADAPPAPVEVSA